MAKKKNTTLDMTVGEPLPHIFHFGIPVFIGNVFQIIYSLVDTMISGHFLGPEAIASIGATTSLYGVLMCIAMGLNNGYGIVIGRTFGAHREDRMRRAIAMMMILDVAVAVLLTLFALLFIDPLMAFMKVPEDIYASAKIYISIIFGGIITTVFYNMCAGFLNAIGNSRIPLCFLIFSCLLNLSCDTLFIAGLHTGVGGAAAATVIAQAAAGTGCFLYIIRTYPQYLPKKEDFLPDMGLIREMFTSGISLALMSSVISIGGVLMQGAINKLGTMIITANTAYRRMFELTALPFSSLTAANSTFASQNYGAGKPDRIRKGIFCVLSLELCWCVIAVILSFFLAAPITTMIIGSYNEEVIGYTSLALRIGTICYPPLCFLGVLRGVMQASDQPIAPIFSSGIEMAMKVLSALFLVPRIGFLGVAVTEPVSWIFCGLFTSFMYFRHQYQLKKQARVSAGEEV